MWLKTCWYNVEWSFVKISWAVWKLCPTKRCAILYICIYMYMHIYVYIIYIYIYIYRAVHKNFLWGIYICIYMYMYVDIIHCADKPHILWSKTSSTFFVIGVGVQLPYTGTYMFVSCWIAPGGSSSVCTGLVPLWFTTGKHSWHKSIIHNYTSF